MKEIIGKGLNLNACNQHASLMIVVYDLLREQAQPRRIVRTTEKGLVFSLKVNLQPRQFESIILKPLRDNLVDYEFSVDYDKRELTVELKEAEEVEDLGADFDAKHACSLMRDRLVEHEKIIENHADLIQQMGQELAELQSKMADILPDLTPTKPKAPAKKQAASKKSNAKANTETEPGGSAGEAGA